MEKKSNFVLKAYVSTKKLDQVIRGNVAQTTKVATGALKIAPLMETLQRYLDEGKESVFLMGFIATDQDTGLMHQSGPSYDRRVGINIRIADDYEERTNIQGEARRLGEVFKSEPREEQPYAEFTVTQDSEEIPF